MSRRWTGPLLVVAALAFTVAVWPSLPQRMPSHWNINGQVDGWVAKGPAVFALPVIAGLVWLLLAGLRRIDPRRENYERFDATFWLLANIITSLLVLIHVMALGAALGWPIDMGRVWPVLMGLMFVVVGNFLPRIRSNWWMGIRTPWTLESESVWRATHRVGGRAFVAAGLVSIAAVLVPPPAGFWVAIGALMVGGAVPVAYSYVAWRREQRAESDHSIKGRSE